MTTLERIIWTINNVDFYTEICIGLGMRVSAGYKSKDCNEGYTKAEKYRAEYWDKLCQYPEEWVNTARLIKSLRSQ